MPKSYRLRLRKNSRKHISRKTYRKKSLMKKQKYRTKSVVKKSRQMGGMNSDNSDNELDLTVSDNTELNRRITLAGNRLNKIEKKNIIIDRRFAREQTITRGINNRLITLEKKVKSLEEVEGDAYGNFSRTAVMDENTRIINELKARLTELEAYNLS